MSHYEYKCPRCEKLIKTSISLSEQPTCSNFEEHHSRKTYWMIPTERSATPKHKITTDKGTKT